MEMERSGAPSGAARHERSPGRTGQRNGYRQRSWSARAVGTGSCKVPQWSATVAHFPSLLEPRRKAERTLSAASRKPTLHGAPPRKADELVKRSRELTRHLQEPGVSEPVRGTGRGASRRFRNRPLEGSYPYVWSRRHLCEEPPGWQGGLGRGGHSRGGEAQSGETGRFWASMLGPSEATAPSGVLFCAHLWLAPRAPSE